MNYISNLFSESDIPAAGSSITEYKKSIKAFQETLKDSFSPEADIRYLVHQRALFTDALLRGIWQQMMPDSTIASLIAVGGYGRGELHPASDIDLLILLKESEDAQTKEALEQLLMFFWDIGLDVGHSVRTLEECITEATADITIATNLMEARLIIGNDDLYADMQHETGPRSIWPSQQFFHAKAEEQAKRHAKYEESAHNLEPNIKANPGGLRDIQMIGWVAKRHFEAGTMYELVTHRFLTEAEFNLLRSGEELLWKIRFALHISTGRHEDRLLFDLQRKLASMFGYPETEGNESIEAFMQKYYRTVIQLNRLNEMLLQLFQEAFIDQVQLKPVAINRRFQAVNGYLEATDHQVFIKDPSCLLEVFTLLAQHKELKGVRASTIRLIRQHKHLIDDSFRKSPRAQKYFLSLFTEGTGLTHQLRRMNRYGILAAYLPAFENIVGRMQYDLFHVYTVDVHTLFMVRNLRRFTVEKYQHEFPLCSNIIENLSLPWIVYLAALFHDIAKGRGGKHEALGADDAAAFCKLHNMSSYEGNMISWLVKNHLVMSMTAQRKDIDDPEVIQEFANTVADRTRLDYLYLMTVADSCATNPERWNDYKDSLLKQLYLSTRKALSRGLDNPQATGEIITLKKEYANNALRKDGFAQPEIDDLWKTLNHDFFLQSSPDEIIWQCKTVLKADNNKRPVIQIRRQTSRGGTEIFVCTDDSKNVFSIMTILLAQQGLKILSARIHSAGNSCTMNNYIVHEQDNNYIESEARKTEIIDFVRDGLLHPENVCTDINTHVHRQIKVFNITPEVIFSQDESNHVTVMRLHASDRPALLAKVSQVFIQHKIKVHSAKIATVGAEAEDTFFISDPDDQPITDQQKLSSLSESIIHSITEN